jgi:hypothetical protein
MRVAAATRSRDGQLLALPGRSGDAAGSIDNTVK